jgi:hypothetical protein
MTRGTRHCTLNPNIVCGRAFPAFITSVGQATRFNQKQLHLLLRKGLVLYTLRNDKHLASGHANRPVAEVNSQFTINHNDGFIRIFVVVPNKVSLRGKPSDPDIQQICQRPISGSARSR